jgi:hypothetical protein
MSEDAHESGPSSWRIDTTTRPIVEDNPVLIDVDELAEALEALRMIAEQAQLDAADALIRECPLRAWEAVRRMAKAAISFSEDWS